MGAGYARAPEVATGYAKPAPPADGRTDIHDIPHPPYRDAVVVAVSKEMEVLAYPELARRVCASAGTCRFSLPKNSARITRVSGVIRPRGSDLLFDHPPCRFRAWQLAGIRCRRGEHIALIALAVSGRWRPVRQVLRVIEPGVSKTSTPSGRGRLRWILVRSASAE